MKTPHEWKEWAAKQPHGDLRDHAELLAKFFCEGWSAAVALGSKTCGACSNRKRAEADLRRLVEEAQQRSATWQHNHEDALKAAEEARADAKRNALSNIELRIEVDRLKGELAEATALIRRCVPDYSCGGATEVEGLIRKFMRPAAPPAEQAPPTYDDGEGRPAPLNAERLISAKPIKAAKAQGEGVKACECKSAKGLLCAFCQGSADNDARSSMWPTIHGLEQHYREVRAQVAELAKRVDVIEEWARRQIAEPWFDPERKPAPPPPEVAAPTTCGCAPGDCAMDDGGIVLSTAFRCRLVSNGCEAHREPEAGVPGHAFVNDGKRRCDVHRDGEKCGLPPWETIHAVPPIPEGK